MRALILLLLLTSVAHASMEDRIYHFVEQSELLQKICFAPDGTYKQGVIHLGDSIKTQSFDCDAQVKALQEEMTAIDEQMKQINPQCSFIPQNAQIDDLIASANSALASGGSCPGTGSATNCFGDLGCNLASSILQMTPLALLGRNSCGGSPTNCIQNAFAGFVYNFTDMGCGLIALFGGSCEENAAPKKSEEEVTSDAAIMASFQTERDVVRFREHPIQWLENKLAPFFESIQNSILERFGCARWEDERKPFRSKCLQPMAWSCANCSIRANMVCGVLGYIGGLVAMDVATGFVIGSVAGIATRAGIKIAQEAAELFPLTTRIGSLAARVAVGAGERFATLWSKVNELKAVQNLRFVGTKIDEAIRAANAAARQRIVGIAASEDAILKAIQSYNRLTESAFLAGYKATGTARAATITKLEGFYPDKVSDLQDGILADAKGVTFKTEQEYIDYRLGSLPEADRARFTIVKSDDGADARFVLTEKKDVDYNSPIRVDLTEPPPPVNETVNEIIVSGTAKGGSRRRAFVSADRQPQVLDRLASKGITSPDLSSSPLTLSVSQQLKQEERILLLNETLGLNVSKTNGQQILKEVDFSERALDPEVFRARRTRVVELLKKEGLDEAEALAAADQLFKSHLLGKYPENLPQAIGGASQNLPVPSSVTDFTAKTELDRELRLVVPDRSADDIIDEIQRGVRVGREREPNTAGLEAFFQRNKVQPREQAIIRSKWEGIEAQRLANTRLNVEDDFAKVSSRSSHQEVSCSDVNKLYADAFTSGATCRRIKFKEEIKGDYCTCNFADSAYSEVRVGPWFTPCASAATNYLTSGNQSDFTALPLKKRALNRCWKVDMPKDLTCYHGGLGPTFQGFGGGAQILCEGSWIDDKMRAAAEGTQLNLPTPDPTRTWKVSRYSPMSNDPRVLSITDAGRQCLNNSSGTICDVADLQDIRRRIDAMTDLDPSDKKDVELYYQYLSGKAKLRPDGGLECPSAPGVIAWEPCP